MFLIKLKHLFLLMLKHFLTLELFTLCNTDCPCGVGYVCKRVEEPRSLPTPGQFFIDEYTVIHYKYTIGRKCVEMSQEDAEQLRLVRP
ncbi:hypothetical protein EB796_002747 [Bugula neritina]|uniref:Uncharacterized protein n=1 Tax=Bugula neritina TaxID=10212 RepID=A0A7J7KKW8_BUGNE|nr:hypothetical protein EB796_002747 [Bugula neritina]